MAGFASDWMRGSSSSNQAGQDLLGDQDLATPLSMHSAYSNSSAPSTVSRSNSGVPTPARPSPPVPPHVSARGSNALAAAILAEHSQAPAQPTEQLLGTALAPAGGTYVIGARSRAGGNDAPQLQVSPVTVLKTEGRQHVQHQIAASASYICYGLSKGQIRVLNKTTAARTLFKGHAVQVVDMRFSDALPELLASADASGQVHVRRVFEEDVGGNGSGAHAADGADPAILDQLLVQHQMQLSEHTARKLAWHPHHTHVLGVALENHVAMILVPAIPGFAPPPPALMYSPCTTGVLTGLTISPAGDLVAAGDSLGYVYVWHMEECPTCTVGGAPHPLGEPVFKFLATAPGSEGGVGGLEFLSLPGTGAGRAALVTGDKDNRQLRLWAVDVAGHAARCTCSVTLLPGDASLPSPLNTLLVHPESCLLVLGDLRQPQVVVARASGTASAPFLDYACDFAIKMPILSMTAVAEPAGGTPVAGRTPETFTLYCVQTEAIQQYTLHINDYFPEATAAPLAVPPAVLGSQPATPPSSPAVPQLASASSSSMPSHPPPPMPSFAMAPPPPSPLQPPPPPPSPASASLPASFQPVHDLPPFPTTLSESFSAKAAGTANSPTSVASSQAASTGSGPGYSAADPATVADALLMGGGGGSSGPAGGRSRLAAAGGGSGGGGGARQAVSHAAGPPPHGSEGSGGFLKRHASGQPVPPQPTTLGSSAARTTAAAQAPLPAGGSAAPAAAGPQLLTPSLLRRPVPGSVGSGTNSPPPPSSPPVPVGRPGQGVPLSSVHAVDLVALGGTLGGVRGGRGAQMDSAAATEGSNRAASQDDNEELEAAAAAAVAAEQRHYEATHPQSASATGAPASRASEAAAAAAAHAEGGPAHAAVNASAAASAAAAAALAAVSVPAHDLQKLVDQVLSGQHSLAKALQAEMVNMMAKSMRAQEAATARAIEAAVRLASRRAEEERKKDEKREREELAKLINTAVVTIVREVGVKLTDSARAASAALAASISPAVKAALQEVLPAQLGGPVMHQALDKALGPPLDRALGSHLDKALGAHLRGVLPRALADGLRDSFATNVIPAFESATQAMFGQIESAFSAGLTEHLVEASGAGREVANALSQSVQRVEAVATQLAETGAAAAAAAAASAASLAASSSSPASVTGGGRHVTLAELEARQDPKAAITGMLQREAFEEAFNYALSLSDVETVVWLCKHFNATALLSREPCPLGQVVLLLLVQQLAFDLTQDVDVKLAWIQEAAPCISPGDAAIAEHCTGVLLPVKDGLARLAAASSGETARIAKRTTLLVNSLLHQ